MPKTVLFETYPLYKCKKSIIKFVFMNSSPLHPHICPPKTCKQKTDGRPTKTVGNFN